MIIILWFCLAERRKATPSLQPCVFALVSSCARSNRVAAVEGDPAETAGSRRLTLVVDTGAAIGGGKNEN